MNGLVFSLALVVGWALAYWAGRRDEELRWRRFVTRAQIMGFDERELDGPRRGRS